LSKPALSLSDQLNGIMTSYKQHFKSTLSLAYPVIIGQLGHVMMGVVDSLMVGRIGAVPLAAASISNGIFFIIFVVGLGISFAISPLIAIAVGAQKHDNFRSILVNGIFLNVITALIIVLILYFGADIIYKLDQPADVAEHAVQYLKIISFSAIPMMVFQTYRQFIEGLSIMRPAMVITIMANVLNILGNWILIFGNLGLPALGLNGAGISTFITRSFMGFMMVYYVMHADRFKEYNLRFRFQDIDFTVVKRILSIGLPSGIQYFFEVGAFASSAILVGWLGTRELAAHQIAMNLATITYMAATGISAAAAIRVANCVGQRDIAETRKAGFSAIIFTVGMMTVFGIVFILFNHKLPEFYIDDTGVIQYAAGLLIIAAFFQIADGTQAVGLGALRGLTDVKFPTVITFIAYWILGVPSGYLLAFVFNLGVNGVWFGYIVGLYASGLMLTIRFNVKSKHAVEVYEDTAVLTREE